MASTLTVSFSHQFSSPIWQIIKEPENGLIFIETRDGDTLSVTFSALSIYSNQFLWVNKSMNERWLVGLLAANKEVLLLQKFASMGNPDKKSVIAVEVKTCKVLWEVADFSFYNWDSHEIWGIRTSGEFAQAKINIENGIVSNTEWIEPVHDKQLETGAPIQYLAGSTHFETVKKFITHCIHQPIEMGVEYLEYNGFILISVYFSETQGLANYLLVFNEQGEMVLKECLAEKVSGLGMGTFFILSGCLFFVKNRLELVAYTFI